MAERHRYRQRKFSLWLFEEEFIILEYRAAQAQMSKTAFIRRLLTHKSIYGKTNFHREDAKAIIYEVSKIGNNINQIAYRANYNKTIDERDFNYLIESFQEYLGVLEKYAIL